MSESPSSSTSELPAQAFHENPDEELEKFKSISKKNFECFAQKVDAIVENLNAADTVWDPYLSLKDKVDSSKDETETLSNQIAECQKGREYAEGEIERLKEDITDLESKTEYGQKRVKEAKEAQKNFEENLKKKHNAYKRANQHYRECLEFYIHVEEVTDDEDLVTFCFFTTEFNDAYSCKLHRKGGEDGTWSLDSVKPEINKKQFDALKQRLQETNDISAFTCTIRIILKNKKEESSAN